MNSAEKASWRVRRVAYVRPSSSFNGCECTVRFLYTTSGESTQASLLLQYGTTFAGADRTPRVIILSISPSNTRSCRLALNSEDRLVPPLVLSHVPSTSVKGPSDVLTLTLTLKTLGTVLHPPDIATFRPASSSDDADFEAFVKICQATDIHLHFARAQFGFVGAQKSSERVQLRQFVGDFNTTQTLPAEFDLVSADSGRGLQEGTWRILNSSSAPQPPIEILGKRRRSNAALSPAPCYNDAFRAQPPYSPTEILTPSPGLSRSLQTSSSSVCSYNIQPTDFKKRPLSQNTQADSFSRVSPLSSEVKLITKDGLQAACMPSDHTRVCASGQPEDPKEQERTRQLLQDMLTTEIEARLASVVERVLPRLTEQALKRVVDPYYDQFYTDCDAAEATMQEKLDENADELKSITYDGVKELEECGEKYLNKLRSRGMRYSQRIEDELQTFLDTVEHESDKFSQLVKFYKTLLQQQQQQTQSIQTTDTTVKRCSSV